jgi:hypothetical protein
VPIVSTPPLARSLVVLVLGVAVLAGRSSSPSLVPAFHLEAVSGDKFFCYVIAADRDVVVAADTLGCDLAWGCDRALRVASVRDRALVEDRIIVPRTSIITAVAISGTTIAARIDYDVRIFERAQTGWTQTAILALPEECGRTWVWDELQLSGTVLLTGGGGHGRYCVFERDRGGWHRTLELAGEIGTQAVLANDRIAVRESETTIAIMARTGPGWSAGPRFAARGGDQFGNELALDGRWLAVLDREHLEILIYDLERPAVAPRRLASQMPNEEFGYALALGGDRLAVIGAVNEVFARIGDEWAPYGTIDPAPGSEYNMRRVAAGQGLIWIGQGSTFDDPGVLHGFDVAR